MFESSSSYRTVFTSTTSTANTWPKPICFTSLFPRARLFLIFGFSCGWLACVVSYTLRKALANGGLAALIHDTASHDAHSTIRSLRSSSTAVNGALDDVIRLRVVFQDDDVPIAERISYWQILGVMEQRFLDAVVDVSPRFDFERKIMCVRASLADDDDQEDKIRGCVHYFLQWTNWSDTRWLGMSRSGRSWMRSRSVGLDELVGLTGIDENEDCNDDYWLGGYKKPSHC